MDRAIGELGLYRSLPESVVLFLGLLTQLGDVWFLALLLSVLFWRLGDRRAEIAALAGVFLSGIGLNNALKHVFAYPRPDITGSALAKADPVVATLAELTTTASGYGFPSGHAFNATLVYVGLAGVLAIGPKRRRYAVAAGIATLVAVTRVGLGVHYVADVAVGAALGLGLLLGVRTLAERTANQTTTSFAIAVPMAGAYGLASEWDPGSLVLLAATLFCLVAWTGAVRQGYVGRTAGERTG